MTTQQVVTLLLGPAGIGFGWWLNQRSTRNLADRAAELAEETEERERVLQTARLARQVASLVRSLLHAMYLKGTYGKPAGLQEMMDEFNRTRDEFRSSVLALRVLGPTWAVAGAERVDVETSKLSELAFLMQQELKGEYVTGANNALPELDRLVGAFVSDLSRQFNATASELPDPPDFDKEGRWGEASSKHRP